MDLVPVVLFLAVMIAVIFGFQLVRQWWAEHRMWRARKHDDD
jgi:hypothetical protein